MAPPKSTAEGWKHVEKLDGPGRHVKCRLCNFEFVGSLTRVMDHLLSITNGKGGGVEGCKNVSAELKETLQKDYDRLKKSKNMQDNKRQRIQSEIALNYSSFPAFSSSMAATGSSSQSMKPSGTATLNTLWKPVQKQEVDDVVADMFFESALPFNVARSPYFINACKMIANFGKGYVPPSSETIRTTLLKRSKERVTGRLRKIKDSWKETGCTIISDGWSDMSHRPLINVLVCCPKGVLFFKVVDASGNKKTSEYIFKILEEAILEVGEQNVVQVVTDSASNCVGAGKMIMEKYKKIYWTPCAAHCLDLLLHDLAKFPWINEVVRKGKQISHFIVNHQLTLSLYRKQASKELLRPCETRFASYYITLKRLVEEKASVRSVICSTEWENSHLSKEAKGKELEQNILGNAFWESAMKVLKICEPIIDMLRMVDSDTPSMGFVYEGMDRCKEAIAKSFNNVENEYMEIWEVIDERWKMLHSPLHAATCFLDPRLFGIERRNDAEVMSGLYAAIERLIPDLEESMRLREQLRAYRLEEGIFGCTSATQDRPKIAPGTWWQFYGPEVPELQRFAVRVLSQTSSASACERNWSSFNHIQSKKRNKLLSTRLEELVYVRSNLKLALSSVAKDASSSSRPWFGPTLSIEEDDLDIDGDSLDELGDDFDDHTSSSGGFTSPCSLDDLELDDVTSRP
jgi:hypothetical protein